MTLYGKNYAVFCGRNQNNWDDVEDNIMRLESQKVTEEPLGLALK